MARRYRTRGIKANKTYQIDELADVTGVAASTARSWLKDGMGCVDDKRPIIILGSQALEYLKARKKIAKRPMAVGEFYCLRCKAPRLPLGAMADYVPLSITGGRLKALCGTCECQCNLNISANKLPDFRKVLDVEIRDTG